MGTRLSDRYHIDLHSIRSWTSSFISYYDFHLHHSTFLFLFPLFLSLLPISFPWFVAEGIRPRGCVQPMTFFLHESTFLSCSYQHCFVSFFLSILFSLSLSMITCRNFPHIPFLIFIDGPGFRPIPLGVYNF